MASYHKVIAVSEQVTCISVQTEPVQVSRKLCDTMEQIVVYFR